MSVRNVPIGQVLHRRADGQAVDPDAEYTMIGLLNRGRGSFVREVIRGSQTKYPRLSPLRAGDLVFSKLFAWEGSVTIAERDGWVSSEFPTYQVDESQIDLGYLSHTVRWDGFVDQLARSTNGLGQRRQRVAPERFEEARVPLPDRPTQRAIAARLDAIAKARDDISDRVGCRPRMSAIAPEAVGRALAALDLPDVPLASLYAIVGDVVRPEDDPREADRFVGLEHVTRDTGNRTGSSGVAERKGRKLRFAAGDVLYGYLRPYLNKVWVADGPGLCSVEQYVLRPADGVDPRLLGHVLRQQPTLDAVNAATHNLQLPRIRTALLGAIRVPDIRRAPPGTAEALDDINARSSQLAKLVSRSGDLVDSLLPAARNEEFALLLAT